MTAAGAGPAAPEAATGLSSAGGRRPRIHRLAWRVGGLAALALAGLIIAAVAAAHYQPLSVSSQGELATQAFPGLPVGRGITVVNTFGYYRQDIYIPPQRGVFSLLVTVANNGSRSVTIVSAAPPPLSMQPAGPVRYLASSSFSAASGSMREVWRVLHDYQLRPGADVEIGMPVQTWPCEQMDGWQYVTDFDVRMRFAGFTRTVQLPWGTSGDALIMRPPGGWPGQPATFCLPGTVLPPPPPGSTPPGDQLIAVSGMIVRIYQAGRAGDLRLTRLPGPDAANGFNDPACLVARPPGSGWSIST